MGYIVPAAQTMKLLIRKKEMELPSAAPMTGKGFCLSRRVVPSQRMAAYQAQITSWSQPNG